MIESRAESTAACLFFLVMEDFYQYFVHRLLHWGIFYKKVVGGIEARYTRCIMNFPHRLDWHRSMRIHLKFSFWVLDSLLDRLSGSLSVLST